MFKRILLFSLTNIAIVAIISVILSIAKYFFGIDIKWNEFTEIIVVSFVIGFCGAGISLLISRWSAKRAYNVTLINASNIHRASEKEKKVYEIITNIANQNNIKMPEVGIYIDNDANAFATWRSKNASLVAISTSLLEQCTINEIEWIIAHEMSHILNGDMVTMTLLQGVLNTFVIFFARIIARAIDEATDGKLWIFGYQLTYILLQILLWLGATLITMRFSRYREFRADLGSAQLVGKSKMIAALRRLQIIHPKLSASWNSQLSAFKISTTEKVSLFSSHPSLENRIKALEENYQLN